MKSAGSVVRLAMLVLSILPNTLAWAASRYTPDAKEAQWIDELNTHLDRMIADYRTMASSPAYMAANLTWGHAGYVRFISPEHLTKYVDALKEAGAKRIDFNPAILGLSDPAVAAKYDLIVKHARDLGLKIAIDPEYWQHEVTSNDFATYMKGVVSYAERYHPDIIVPVHEPTTMDARWGARHTPAQWRKFVEDCIQGIKAVSPATKVGAGAFFKELDYYKEFASIPNLDYLTYDIYIDRPKALAIYDQMAEIAHKAGKPVYMEETGRPSYIDLSNLPADWQSKSLEEYSHRGTAAPELEPLTIKWLTAIKLYGDTRGLESVTLFETMIFFTYATGDQSGSHSPEYNRAVKKAVAGGERTDTFRAFQKLAL